VISKCDQAQPAEMDLARRAAREHNPAARVVEARPDAPLAALAKELAPWLS